MKALFKKIIDALPHGTRCPDCGVKEVKTNTFFESFISGVEKYQCPKCGKKIERDLGHGSDF